MTDEPKPRKRGRPKVDDSARLSHVLQLRLNDAQRAYLLVLAEGWGCSMGEAVRRCIEETLDADERTFEGLDVDGKPATMRQILGILKPDDGWLTERLSELGQD